MLDKNEEQHLRELIARIRALSTARVPRIPDVPMRTGPIPGIRAVLFDVYGTILTTGLGEAGHVLHPRNPADAAFQALESAGFRLLSPDSGSHAAAQVQEAIRSTHARAHEVGTEFPEVDIRECWRNALRELNASGDVEGEVTPRIIERLAIEYECRINPSWPMPGLRATLNRLHRAGMRIGIVSNAQFYTPLILRAFNHETGWQDGLWCEGAFAWSYEMREAKPSSRLVGRAVEFLGRSHDLPPESILCVGNDVKLDIVPAAQRGCRTALFAGDTQSLRLDSNDASPARVFPDLVIPDLGTLADALSS